MIAVLQKHLGTIAGVGLMFIWGSACLPWVELTQSGSLTMKLVGMIGTALVSISGIAIAFYGNDTEQKLRRVGERNALNEVDAAFWREQARLAIELLEKERALHK